MRRMFPLLPLMLIVLGLLSVSACKKNTPSPEAGNTTDTVKARPAVKVGNTVTASLTDAPHFVTLTGSLVADKRAEVAADAVGKILDVKVERGEFVKKGEVLIKLDTRNTQISAREVDKNISLATEQAAQARAECDRAEKLFSAGAMTQAEHDRIQLQCRTTNLSVELAKVRQDNIKKTLGDSSIKAPFSGLIAEKYVEMGEYVTPQSRVVQLVSIDPIRLRLNIPEKIIPSVKLGSRVEFSVDAYQDETFSGEVRYVSPVVREAARDLYAEVVVNNKAQKLRPGMFAVSKLLAGDNKSIVLPKESVMRSGTTARVFAVNNNAIVEYVVEVGDEIGNNLEIRSGLPEGTKVISPYPKDARDGDPVAM